ncbi:MAG TPA: hypothetical protein VGH27_33155 [Streptosporangiaceae bacterium]|jgi:alpha-tubulin suppressor-like RCC1 family protein
MALTKALTVMGAALCAAGACVAGSPVPSGTAWGQSIEHWGAYATGGAPFDVQLSPVSLFLPAPVTEIGTSNSTQYALLTNGTVWAWGAGGDGQLGDGDTADWGYNLGGQVGNGTTIEADSPYQVPLPTGVTQVAQGGSFTTNGQTIVLLSGGALYAWGTDRSHQLGNGATGSKLVPVQITPPAGVTYTTVACGGSTCYGITPSGAVYAWGQNNYGQVGDGSTTTAKRPVKVTTGAIGISATAHDVAVSTVSTG